MPTKDPRIDAYIANSADFAKPILNHFRTLVHAACPQVEETLKWSCPHFMYKGMLCSMASFKNHCTFGFWKHSLILNKHQGAKPGDASMGQFGRITALSDLPKDALLTRYIKEAARLNEAGIKLPARPKPEKRKELAIPDEFMAVLKKNPKALSAFENFSYSHKKEYVHWISEAKRDQTRKQRIETALAWLAEGKPRHWKYTKR